MTFAGLLLVAALWRFPAVFLVCVFRIELSSLVGMQLVHDGSKLLCMPGAGRVWR